MYVWNEFFLLKNGVGGFGTLNIQVAKFQTVFSIRLWQWTNGILLLHLSKFSHCELHTWFFVFKDLATFKKMYKAYTTRILKSIT